MKMVCIGNGNGIGMVWYAFPMVCIHNGNGMSWQ
jgi:hypothetical protein